MFIIRILIYKKVLTKLIRKGQDLTNQRLKLNKTKARIRNAIEFII